MSINVTVNGSSKDIPETSDDGIVSATALSKAVSFNADGKGLSFGGTANANRFDNYMETYLQKWTEMYAGGKVHGNFSITGDTYVAGMVRNSGGQFNSPDNGGTNGTSGYVNIVRFTFTSGYQNRPILFTLLSRGKDAYKCQLRMNNNSDPTAATINSFKVRDSQNSVPVYATFSSGVVNIYVEKSESYDGITVSNLMYSASVTVSYPNTLVSSVPSGYVQATPLLGTASTSTQGFMSTSDKSKLDGINQSWLKSTIGEASTSTNGLLSTSDKSKLNNLDSWSTAQWTLGKSASLSAGAYTDFSASWATSCAEVMICASGGDNNRAIVSTTIPGVMLRAAKGRTSGNGWFQSIYNGGSYGAGLDYLSNGNLRLYRSGSTGYVFCYYR